jgi:hypothetical protein
MDDGLFCYLQEMGYIEEESDSRSINTGMSASSLKGYKVNNKISFQAMEVVDGMSIQEYTSNIQS